MGVLAIIWIEQQRIVSCMLTVTMVTKQNKIINKINKMYTYVNIIKWYATYIFKMIPYTTGR